LRVFVQIGTDLIILLVLAAVLAIPGNGNKCE